jgi:methylphosphotriester-DNA--protein-cysteine methyltransferase
MMYRHEVITADLGKLIRLKEIQFGGNSRLKIYGLLTCASGQRMKKQNRVFFKTEEDALRLGFRPCGQCLKEQYNRWKSEQEAG